MKLNKTETELLHIVLKQLLFPASNFYTNAINIPDTEEGKEIFGDISKGMEKFNPPNVTVLNSTIIKYFIDKIEDDDEIRDYNEYI